MCSPTNDEGEEGVRYPPMMKEKRKLVATMALMPEALISSVCTSAPMTQTRGPQDLGGEGAVHGTAGVL